MARVVCLTCNDNREFAMLNALESHVRAKHPTLRYLCQTCKNGFLTPNHLIQHRNEYHSERERHRRVGRHHRGRRPAR